MTINTPIKWWEAPSNVRAFFSAAVVAFSLHVNSVLANDTPQPDSDISESHLEYCNKINDEKNKQGRPLPWSKSLLNEKELSPFEKSLYAEYISNYKNDTYKKNFSQKFLKQVKFIRNTCILSQDAAQEDAFQLIKEWKSPREAYALVRNKHENIDQ